MGRQAVKLGLAGIGHEFLGRSVIEAIDLTVDAGEIVAVIGPSGCGKTTLLQIAADLVEPLRGTVERRYARHAVVFQEPRLLPWRTAEGNIAYGLDVLKTPKRRKRDIACALALRVGLSEADLEKYPAELSGGMRQRVAIARSLAIEPDMVFFDEPFSALDVGRRRALQDLILAQAEQRRFSGLFVTHDLFEAARLAHRIVVLSYDGRIAGIRDVAGSPGHRSDRDIQRCVGEWLERDGAFAHVFDVDESRDA